MWLALRLAAILHKGARQDATTVPSDVALRLATVDGARAVGLAGRIGTLEPGMAADAIILDLDGPHASPLFDPVNHVVFAAGRGDVRHVFVAGKQVVRDRELTRADLGAIKAEVKALQPAIRGTLD